MITVDPVYDPVVNYGTMDYFTITFSFKGAGLILSLEASTAKEIRGSFRK